MDDNQYPDKLMERTHATCSPHSDAAYMQLIYSAVAEAGGAEPCSRSGKELMLKVTATGVSNLQDLTTEDDHVAIAELGAFRHEPVVDVDHAAVAALLPAANVPCAVQLLLHT